MTPAAFKSWRERMGFRFDTEAAAALGCTRETVRRYTAGEVEIPLYIALACAAIEAGIGLTTTSTEI